MSPPRAPDDAPRAVRGTMRVLFIGPAAPSHPSGDELQQVCSMLRIAAGSVDVRLLAPSTTDSQSALVRSVRDVLASVDLLPVDAPSPWSAFGKPAEVIAQHSSTLVARTREALADEQLDLVHVDSLLLVPWLRLRTRVPIVLRHSFDPAAALNDRFLRKTLRRALEVFDLHLCLSAADVAVLSGLRRKPFLHRLVPPGVDAGYFAPPDRPPERNPDELLVLVHPASADDPEALRWLARSILPEIRSRHPGAFVTVAGPGLPMAVRAVALREDLQVEADTGDVRPLLARAGCCVAPYPHGTAPGHWLLEALAMGAPVVATPEAIAGLEVTDGEELLIASDPDGFANDVRRLMRDVELREKISRNARRRVLAAFSWEVVGNQLIEAWRTAGARSRR